MQEEEQDIKHNILEAVVRRCSVKKVFLEFRKTHRKTPVTETLLIKLHLRTTASDILIPQTIVENFLSVSLTKTLNRDINKMINRNFSFTLDENNKCL